MLVHITSIRVHNESCYDKLPIHQLHAANCSKIFPYLPNLKSLYITNSWTLRSRNWNILDDILFRLPNPHTLQLLQEKSYVGSLIKFETSTNIRQAGAKLAGLRSLILDHVHTPPVEVVRMAHYLPNLQHLMLGNIPLGMGGVPSLLFQAYVDVSKRDEGGSPVDLITKFFGKSDSDLIVGPVRLRYMSLLHEACAGCSVSVIDTVVSKYGFKDIDIHCEHHNSISPLHVAVALGKLDAVKHLVTQYGASISHRITGVNRLNSLELASYCRQSEVLTWLLNHADPVLLDAAGVYRLFVSCGADQYGSSQDPSKRKEMFLLLCDYVSQRGWTLKDIKCDRTGRSLIFSVETTDMLELLLDQGFLLTETDNMGGTLLQKFARFGTPFVDLINLGGQAKMALIQFLFDYGYPKPEANSLDMKALLALILRSNALDAFPWVLDHILTKASSEDLRNAEIGRSIMSTLLWHERVTRDDIRHLVAERGMKLSLGWESFWLDVSRFKTIKSLPKAGPWELIVGKLTEAFKADDAREMPSLESMIRKDTLVILVNGVLKPVVDDPQKVQLLQELILEISHCLERHKVVENFLFAEKVLNLEPSKIDSEFMRTWIAIMTRTIYSNLDKASEAGPYLNLHAFNCLFDHPS